MWSFRKNKNQNEPLPEVKKRTLSMKIAGFFSRFFMILAVSCVFISAFAPFKPNSLQANIFNQITAKETPQIQNKLLISTTNSGLSAYSPGAEDVILGTFYFQAPSEPVTVTGIIPCLKNITGSPVISRLKVFVDDQELKAQHSIEIPGKGMKKLVIKGTIIAENTPGSRFQAGICQPPKSEEVSLDSAFPYYDETVSIVGIKPVKATPAAWKKR